MEKLDGDEVTDPKRARRWAFWYWKRIPSEGDVYMRRLNILMTPWFSIKLHFIYRPDAQRDLHDHPWSFLSFLIWGTYVEEVPVKEKPCGMCDCEDCRCETAPRHVRWFNWKRAEDRHSITWISDKPIVTLVICGSVRRTWGFWTKDSDPKGWVRHDKYETEA